MKSLWEDTSKISKRAWLEKDIKTDVLIIGGGITGLLCAYMLDKASVDYILVEGRTLCSGVTKNTSAKITSQHGLIYDKLIKEFGVDEAKLYFEANQSAVNDYKKICEEKNINCNFENKNAYVYSLDDFMKIEREIIALEKMGCYYDFADFVDELPLPFSVAGAIRLKNQAQFNPLQFVEFISKDLNIYEHTFVKEIKVNNGGLNVSSNMFAVTENATIVADKIIVATHFPFINSHGNYFMKMYQERSYAIALEGAAEIDGMYVDERQNGMSFRNYNNLLLIGGGDHRTGNHGGNWKELRLFAKEYYPSAIEKFWWATQDCMTLDGVPYIGSYSKNTPNLYVATGFNKWGMSSAMVAANLLTDIILGNKNQYERLFSSSRSMMRPQLFKNVFNTTIDMLIPTTKRCSHLACALRRNPYEHTWDCPCHGSRFTNEGDIIDNPATKGIF